MSIKITAGSKKGHKIVVSKDLESVIRPTQDKVRQAIFSSIYSKMDLDSLAVLDLFSGTGMMSFEALSRGVSSSVAIEKDREAARYILENSKKLGFQEHLQVIQGSVESKLGSLITNSFDLIFIDPPYKKYQLNDILNPIINNRLLNTKGVIVYEEDQEFFSSQFAGQEDRISSIFKEVVIKNYGQTAVTFFWN